MWKKATSLVFPLLGVLAFGGALVSTVPQRVADLRTSYELYAAPPLAHMNPSFLSAFMLGQKAVYDDFIAIYLLQTLMQTDVQKDHVKLMEQIRSVIKHQPKLETTYMLACFVMLNELKRPEYCQEINLTGLKAFPMSWRLLMTQAFVEYSAMNHPAQGASFLMMAAQRENAPAYVKKAAEKLLTTKSLTDEDIKASLELISQSEGNTQFVDLLKSIEKNKKPKPETDQTESATPLPPPAVDGNAASPATGDQAASPTSDDSAAAHSPEGASPADPVRAQDQIQEKTPN